MRKSGARRKNVVLLAPLFVYIAKALSSGALRESAVAIKMFDG